MSASTSKRGEEDKRGFGGKYPSFTGGSFARPRSETHPAPRKRLATPLITYPLDQFEDARLLVMALTDCIEAHRSLYEIGNTLHGNICPYNLRIVAPNQEGQSGCGMLIDLDIATPYARWAYNGIRRKDRD
ncbi:hypothetical protein JAAARDRAFT_42857 [Jaapia argillacea MUCL 33604]|uniref:Fungal-type protein kinase domain-containing protein n=1 Tax=Jaapia argillacea MUCL 33604 TaxID=933084 RepID=A0A067P3P2_9AGAM|nr:hypothetical protein JAAARDRAFT_42857 [Jaapia argillacea MUCL 33604]